MTGWFWSEHNEYQLDNNFQDISTNLRSWDVGEAVDGGGLQELLEHVHGTDFTNGQAHTFIGLASDTSTVFSSPALY